MNAAYEEEEDETTGEGLERWTPAKITGRRSRRRRHPMQKEEENGGHGEAVGWRNPGERVGCSLSTEAGGEGPTESLCQGSSSPRKGGSTVEPALFVMPSASDITLKSHICI